MSDGNFIWRIETGAGKGAYHGGLCSGEGQYYGECHPSPYGDGIPDFPSGSLFGFGSVLHARRWFSSVHDLNDWEKSHDAKLVVYRMVDVDKVVTGKQQLTFLRNDATPVKLPASDLHRLRVKELVGKVEGEFARLHADAAW